MKRMTVIVAMLAMSLAACASGLPALPKITESDVRRVCPDARDYTDEELLLIAEALIVLPAHPGLDLLSTDWERLEEQARICRGSK